MDGGRAPGGFSLPSSGIRHPRRKRPRLRAVERAKGPERFRAAMRAAGREHRETRHPTRLDDRACGVSAHNHRKLSSHLGMQIWCVYGFRELSPETQQRPRHANGAWYVSVNTPRKLSSHLGTRAARVYAPAKSPRKRGRDGHLVDGAGSRAG